METVIALCVVACVAAACFLKWAVGEIGLILAAAAGLGGLFAALFSLHEKLSRIEKKLDALTPSSLEETAPDTGTGEQAAERERAPL